MIGQTISHYKILEKLGEGGMGVVYKAHDTKLERIVALKFLPNYLTSDAAEKERFYHEARAAASLTHQNVAVIYEIGEHEGQLFLAMEFVEGKTLKKLVEHDGETLSLKKVLDMAIQACEGLAAAHEKGIVHRDIKSDNIMMTAKGQVKIMDFGLAKVKGATKLTKAGSTLGTAAYMSPEQAQGEEVDLRSDIFSFGVVLYELLTTKLPFRGEHQAALMYSLINEEPQPIARFNEKVSPDLERIVLKALAKDKEERYQHIDDMLADVRRERKNFEYARAGYATTSTVVQASQPKPPVAQPTTRGIPKYVIPAGVIVIAVVLFVIFNPFNFQISTQKSTAASEKSSLAVMYFQNIPDPEDKDHTGDMLSDLLITALSQTRGLEVISRERLFDIQKELQADSKTITPEMATKIAQRAGVTTMLLGSILQKEPELALTVRLVDVKSGNIIKSERVTGFTSQRIFSLVDTLALLVRNDLQVTTISPAETKSVSEVTTKSPEAYRSYLEGIELNNRFYTAEATAAFRRAIELDSNFAMAYFRLANVNLSTLSTDEFQTAMSRAYALSGTVSERERLLIQSTYASEIERDNPKAISLLETIVQKYPLEESAYGALANLYAQDSQFDKVSQLFLREAQIDSLNKNVWNSLAYTFAGLNRRQEAFNAINRYVELAPAEANPYDSKGDIYAMFDERDSAIIWWQKAIAFRADFPSGEKIFTSALTRRDYGAAEKYFHQFTASKHDDERLYDEIYPLMLLVQGGQLVKARAEFLKIFESHKAKKLADWLLRDLGALCILEYELHDYKSMLNHAQQYSDALRRDTVSNPTYEMILAIAQSKNGNRQAATKILETLRGIADRDRIARTRYEFGSAIIAYEDEKYDAALQHFDSALKRVQPHHAPLYFHAMCQLKAGHLQQAIPELQRLTRWSPIAHRPFDLDGLPMSEYWLIAPVKAYYALGVAYEQQGQNDQAIKSYEKFLQIWKDADFDSAELKYAKVHLSKLKGIAAK